MIYLLDNSGSIILIIVWNNNRNSKALTTDQKRTYCFKNNRPFNSAYSLFSSLIRYRAAERNQLLMESSQGVLDFLRTVACRTLRYSYRNSCSSPRVTTFTQLLAGRLHKIRLLSCSKYVTVISGELVFKILNERANSSWAYSLTWSHFHGHESNSERVWKQREETWQNVRYR